MSDKPATGEWMGDDDGVLLPMHRFIGQYAREIADAHNAALAAEYQRALQTARLNYEGLLAAERDIGWNEGREHERKCNEAAREDTKHYRELFNEIRKGLGDLIPTDATKKEIIDCVKQLAAAKIGGGK